MHREVHEVWAVLSLEKCRKLLPVGATHSDEEVETLRKVLSALAETIVDQVPFSYRNSRDHAVMMGTLGVKDVASNGDDVDAGHEAGQSPDVHGGAEEASLGEN